MERAFETPAQWYDGHTALRHAGTAVWNGRDTLALHGEGGASRIELSLAALRFAETRRSDRVYTLADQPDFRLILPADLPAGLGQHLPRHAEYGGWIDRIGLGKAAAGFAVVSAAAVALFLTAPDWLGPRIPESFERQMGDALVGDFGNRLCHTPEGDAAMAKLLAAVDPAKVKVRAGIANIDMVNAVALPGGQVLLFDGLVQQAESPEELAGVLGHEVGHVRERHVMTAMLRQFGMSTLLSGANSGVTNGVVGVATMGYSRDAEREADAYARARMAQSDVSPLGSAEFFERMRKESGDEDTPAVVGWIASHPASGERAKAYRNSAVSGHRYKPVLTAAEFAAIKSACAKDRDVESFDLF